MLRRFMLSVLTIVALLPLVVRAQELREMPFFLTFVPNIQFAPLYVAIENGYFTDAGMRIEIEHGDEPDGVNLVAAGERSFAMISGEQVIAARANGRPVVSVYEWFQKYPVGIVVPDDSPVETPTDLRGMRIGIPGPFGASYTGLVALLTAGGLTEQDIQLEAIGFNAPQVFCVGAVEAAVVYINNEPTQIDNLAENGECGSVTGVRVLNVSDYADMVSNGIITSEAMIADEPDMVMRFVTAFHNGLADTLNNPAEAYLHSHSYIEGLPLDQAMFDILTVEANAAQTKNLGTYEAADARAELLARLIEAAPDSNWTQFEILLNTALLWEAPSLGESDLDSWEATQDILISMGTLTEPIAVEDAVTNQFVPMG